MAELERHRGFLEHMEWADARMWKSVRAVPAAQNDQRLLALLHHLHLVQWIYLSLRAQVATRVRDLGGEPALTDYIAWIWMNRPLPEW